MRILSVSLRVLGTVTLKLGAGNPMPCNLLGRAGREGGRGGRRVRNRCHLPHRLLDQLRLAAACSCPQTSLLTSYKCVFALTSLPRNLSLKITMACAKHIALKMFFTALLVIFKSRKSSNCQQWALGSGGSAARGLADAGPRKTGVGVQTPAPLLTSCGLAKCCLQTCLIYERWVGIVFTL